MLLSRIDAERVQTKRKRWFRAKGTPDGLQVFSVEGEPESAPGAAGPDVKRG